MSSKTTLSTLKKHPLIGSLLNLRGNQRVCLYTEPLWGIPHSLYAPYATLYMYALGLKDQQIGLIISVSMLVQVVSSLMAGVIADKLGRKRTTFVFDVFAWSITSLIWALSQNFWWFLAAAVTNSVWQVTNISWTCLLVEDAQEKELVNMFSWRTIAGLMAVLFAPLAGLLVGKLTLVPAMRILYFFAFACLTTKIFTLNHYATETKRGEERMAETRDQSIFRMLAQYKDVFLSMLRSGQTMYLLAIMVLLNITSMVTDNFFGLYVTKQLLIADTYVAYFPMARAILMLAFLFGVQPRMDRLPYKPPMLLGLGFYLVSHVALILSAGAGRGLLLLVYILFEAFGFSLLIPRKESLFVLFIEPEERARTMSLITVLMLAVTAPFGWLVGFLSEINRMLPFALNILLFVLCGALLLKPASGSANDSLMQKAPDAEKSPDTIA